MVGPRGTGEDGPMPEPATVWMVKLQRVGDLRELKGTLRMDEEALVFTDRSTEVETRLPFAATRKVKRIVGSPVLILTWQNDAGATTQTAFYFAEPPPIRSAHGVGSPQPPPATVLQQPSRRRQRREGIRYLTARSRSTSATIKGWAEEIRARVRA